MVKLDEIGMADLSALAKLEKETNRLLEKAGLDLDYSVHDDDLAYLSKLISPNAILGYRQPEAYPSPFILIERNKYQVAHWMKQNLDTLDVREPVEYKIQVLPVQDTNIQRRKAQLTVVRNILDYSSEQALELLRSGGETPSDSRYSWTIVAYEFDDMGIPYVLIPVHLD